MSLCDEFVQEAIEQGSIGLASQWKPDLQLNALGMLADSVQGSAWLHLVAAALQQDDQPRPQP